MGRPIFRLDSLYHCNDNYVHVADNFAELFKKQQLGKGVKVITNENRILLDLFVVLKYGVPITAVAEAIKKAVKFKVEQFSGMIVDTVNIIVLGVRV